MSLVVNKYSAVALVRDGENVTHLGRFQFDGKHIDVAEGARPSTVDVEYLAGYGIEVAPMVAVSRKLLTAMGGVAAFAIVALQRIKIAELGEGEKEIGEMAEFMRGLVEELEGETWVEKARRLGE